MQRNQQVRFGGGRLETQVKLCAGRLPYLLVFSNDLSDLHGWRKEIIYFLATYRLIIHENAAHPRPSSTGVPFLGFQVFPDYRRLKRKKVVHIRRQLKEMLSEYRQGKISISRLSATLIGWINHARYGNTWGLREALLSKITL